MRNSARSSIAVLLASFAVACSDAASTTGNSNTDSATVTDTDAGAGAHTDAGAGAHTDASTETKTDSGAPECTSGATRCEGLVPQTCDAAGTWQSGAPCAYVCSDGACTGACVPSAKQCDGILPESCDEAGAWQSADACPYVCSSGECTGACVPNSKDCSGLVPRACDATGTWQGADPCPYVCSAGECTGVCVPDTMDCSGLVPRRCDAAGAWQPGDACPYVCSSGECTGVCVPGDRRCADGTSVELCDATGQWQKSACLQVCSEQTNQCACAPGYTGDGVACTPIDFCDAANGGCSPNATCTQTGIAPTCACNQDFSGDGLACNSSAPLLLNEGFDSIGALSSAGWSLTNRSSPVGSTSWFQGSDVSANGPFDAYDGSANGYIGANYNNTGNTGTISNWLVTPTVAFGAGSEFSFYTRGPAGGQYPDRIEIRVCVGNSCDAPADSGTGSFTTLIGSLNPTLARGGYPDTWTKLTFKNQDGIPTSGSGRLAIRYYVTSAGLSGTNSDYIGIDRLTLTSGTPAYSIGGTVSGLTNDGLVLWLNGNEQRPVAADGSYSFAHVLDTNTPYAVSIYQHPSGQTCVVSSGSGKVASADVSNVTVTCTTN